MVANSTFYAGAMVLSFIAIECVPLKRFSRSGDRWADFVFQIERIDAFNMPFAIAKKLQVLIVSR